VRLLLRSTHGLTPTRGGPKFLRTRQTVDRRSRGSRTRRARRRSGAYGPTADFCAGDVRAASNSTAAARVLRRKSGSRGRFGS
jgi:hypothetical protein